MIRRAFPRDGCGAKQPFATGELFFVAVDPARFVREVRSEVSKVTWPSRKETMVTTGLVIAMVALAAVFFLVVDQVIGVGVRALFAAGI
jgi:preprotein translocase subunit SecE